MKLSKALHIISVLVGFTGVVAFVSVVLGGSDDLVFGITKQDTLLCSAILILIAIWSQVGAIHHIMLEKSGRII